MPLFLRQEFIMLIHNAIDLIKAGGLVLSNSDGASYQYLFNRRLSSRLLFYLGLYLNYHMKKNRRLINWIKSGLCLYYPEISNYRDFCPTALINFQVGILGETCINSF